MEDNMKFLNNISKTSSESEDEVKSGFMINVVICKSAIVLKLLSCEDESLLIRRDAFLVLNLGLNVLDSIRWLNIKSNGLACQSLDKYLHTTSESEDKVKSRFLLNVVIRESAAILELLSSEDESLLIRRDSFLVLNLGLDVVDGVRSFNIESDGFACQRFDEDLHATS